MNPERTPPSVSASAKRFEANQVNAQKSPGPTSEQGKRASSQNALKWGFFSKKALLPGESWEEFEAFALDVLKQLSPRNSVESHLVQQYVAIAWRLKRLPEIEAGVFARYGISVQGNACGSVFAMVANLQSDDVLGQLARYEATLRKGQFKYLDLLRTFRKDGWGANATPVLDAQVVNVMPESGGTGGSPPPVQPGTNVPNGD
jgi:hypothetical protein